MTSGFYGNDINLYLPIDKIYPNYTAAQSKVNTDEVFLGRYILINYNFDKGVQSDDVNTYKDNKEADEAIGFYHLDILRKSLRSDGTLYYATIGSLNLSKLANPGESIIDFNRDGLNPQYASDKKIDTHYGGIRLNVQLDGENPNVTQTATFTLNIPELGNAISDMWDVVFDKVPNSNERKTDLSRAGAYSKKSYSANTLAGCLGHCQRLLGYHCFYTDLDGSSLQTAREYSNSREGAVAYFWDSTSGDVTKIENGEETVILEFPLTEKGNGAGLLAAACEMILNCKTEFRNFMNSSVDDFNDFMSNSNTSVNNTVDRGNLAAKRLEDLLDTTGGRGINVGMIGTEVGNSQGEIFNNYAGAGKNTATGTTSHAEGWATTASGNWGAHSEGDNTKATNSATHAEGYFAEAKGEYSHAGGNHTIAAGESQTAIGKYNIEDSTKAFIIGNGTSTERSNALAVDWNGDAEFSGIVKSNGEELLTKSDASDTYLTQTNASNTYAKLNGGNTFSGNQTITGTLAQGSGCTAGGQYSHAEGVSTETQGPTDDNSTNGLGAHAEGRFTYAEGLGAHAEGNGNDNDSRNTASGIGAHCEGHLTSATGTGSHAEGRSTIANGDCSHAEGQSSEASAQSAHAEGGTKVNSSGGLEANKTTASGVSSHAEGSGTTASGYYSHAEGFGTAASGVGSHTEGSNTIARGSYSHAEGHSTLVETYAPGGHAEGGVFFDGTKETYLGTNCYGVSAHAEGVNTRATGNYSHAEGQDTFALGQASHAEGISTQTAESGFASHAEGGSCIAEGTYSHAEGSVTKAKGNASHAEGGSTIAYGQASHSEGKQTATLKDCCHSEGELTLALGPRSHAEGYQTVSGFESSHIEGGSSNSAFSLLDGKNYTEDNFNTYNGILVTYNKDTDSNAIAQILNTWNTQKFALSRGNYSHVEGLDCLTLANCAHAEGQNTRALQPHSHSSGLGTVANTPASTVIGKYNKGRSDSFFIIGNGTSINEENQSNAFRVDIYGNCYVTGSVNNNTNADFAEYFEWKDKNVLEEDRRGLFVTLESDKIRLANSEDDYILGAVTSTGAFIGNSASEDWQGKYLKNIFGEIQYKEIEFPAETIIEKIKKLNEETGEMIEEEIEIEVIPARIEKCPILNPEYNSSQDYISREFRPEWSPIGLCGQVIIVDDGTCEVNGYCYPGQNGVGTKSDKGYRVMKRLDDTHIKVLIK